MQDKNGKKRNRLFSLLEKFLSLSGFLDRLPTKHIAKLTLMFFIGILYVANTHIYDKLIYKLNILEQEVEGLRVEYATIKAGCMVESKRSAIEKNVQKLDLIIDKKPPIKIKRPKQNE